jgi:hypothetical protein
MGIDNDSQKNLIAKKLKEKAGPRYPIEFSFNPLSLLRARKIVILSKKLDNACFGALLPVLYDGFLFEISDLYGFRINCINRQMESEDSQLGGTEEFDEGTLFAGPYKTYWAYYRIAEKILYDLGAISFHFGRRGGILYQCVKEPAKVILGESCVLEGNCNKNIHALYDD